MEGRKVWWTGKECEERRSNGWKERWKKCGRERKSEEGRKGGRQEKRRDGRLS